MSETTETTSAAPPVVPVAAVEEGQTVGAIEADNTIDDGADSSYGGDDSASSTASISSSILKYREENGRTYHTYKDGAYILPNDERENDRLDLQHALFGLTLGNNKLFGAPIPESQTLHQVLDVGCGTGIWSMDFGDAYPASSVSGIDLSPIQPRFVPPNVSFEIDDLEAQWTFTKPFDFIFERMTVSAFANPKRYFEQAYEHLVPGGWVECLDICWPISSDDGTLKDDSDLAKWGKCMDEGYHTLGRSGESPRLFKEQMEDAGFINVTEVVYKWPQNSKWPKSKKFKELGMWTLANIEPGLEGLSLAIFTRMLGWTAEEVQVFLVKVRKDMRSKDIHAYFPIYNVYGQKPLAPTTSASTK